MIQFELRESRQEDWLRLTLYGELDLLGAPRLDERLRELRSGDQPVVLDRSQLEFLDCSGLGVLIWATRAAGQGWPFRIDPRMAAQPQRLIELVASDLMAAERPRSLPAAA